MLIGLNQLVDAIGLEPSLRLIAGWGGSTLYVPGTYTPDHLITKIIGTDGAIKLERTYGGQTISVPKLLLQHIKLEVSVIKLIAKGFSTREAAHLLGVSKERAKQIVGKHRKGSEEEGIVPGDPGEDSGRGAADPRISRSARTSPASYRSK